MHEHLTEHIADWRSAIIVEKESRTIRNVALAGTDSKNGYRYTETALKAAVPFYENVPVFLDHPASAVRPRDRSARDLAGSVTGVRYESGRLRGDVRTLDTEAGRTLLALAEANTSSVGMSHVVLAERSGNGATVERIVEVVSVDAVAFPATTSTFRESTTDEPLVVLNPVPLTRGRGETGEGSDHGCPASCIDAHFPCKGRLQETSNLSPVPSPPTPFPRERGVSIAKTSTLNLQPSPTLADGPATPERFDRSEKIAPSSSIESSAPSVRPPMPGSLERLLASVDAELPRHLRRLAAAPGSPQPGRGARVGIFPFHIILEWSSVGGLPEHYALTWDHKPDGLTFGDKLIPLTSLGESLGSWAHLLTSSRKEADDTTQVRLDRLEQRLLETTAERDRLAARLDARTDRLARIVERHRGPTSVLRRQSPNPAVADELFVRTVRRQ